MVQSRKAVDEESGGGQATLPADTLAQAGILVTGPTLSACVSLLLQVNAPAGTLAQAGILVTGPPCLCVCWHKQTYTVGTARDNQG